MEIEPIYLVGNFSVVTDGEFEELDNNAVRYKGGFRIGKPTETIIPKNLEKQGFPFFAGSMVLEKTLIVNDTNQKIVFDKKGVNVLLVNVNGTDAGKILWNPTEIDLSNYLQLGENRIKITLINNLRNMLGPHHLDEGESHYVSVASFYKENHLWTGLPKWNDNHCFVKFGII